LQDRFKLKINPSIDVNDSTAIILNAKKYEKGKTGVILIGGGSPKNFMLQTEPQIQEVLMIPEVGQDYDINVTDARPDTGGLSGAPPSEAASWGKIDPTKLEEAVTAYLDVTVARPGGRLARDHPAPAQRQIAGHEKLQAFENNRGRGPRAR
jgi:deoxyhypusine synthase